MPGIGRNSPAVFFASDTVIMVLLIMVTAAAVLHDNPDVVEPKSAAEVAHQRARAAVVVMPPHGSVPRAKT